MIDVVLCASGSDEVRIVHDLARGIGGRARVVRRCADLAETRAVVSAGIGDAVIIDLTVRGLDRDAAAELLRTGAAVVGLRPESIALERTSLGLRHVVDASAAVPEILAAVEAALGSDADADAWIQDPESIETGLSRIVAVWGPVGSPGRSTIAANLASEAAADGIPTVLVDADTYAPSLGQMLGVLEDSPGLVAACRSAGRDTLDDEALDSLLPALGPNLRFLSGIGVPARWAEVRESSLERVWAALRRRGGLIVVDVSAPLEEDEELSYDTSAPQRNAAALSAMRTADAVLAAVTAEPVSITRLIRERDRLEELDVNELHVVVNRSSSLVPADRVRGLIAGRCAVASLHSLPEDVTTCRRAAWDGTLLAESAPRSPLRKALRGLAGSTQLLGPVTAVAG